MRNLFLLFAAVLISQTSFAISAVRRSDEVFAEAYLRNATNFNYKVQSTGSESAILMKLPYEKLNFAEVPELANVNEVNTYFEIIRDERFLKSQEASFLRRAAWMFPDDGCWIRAELASQIAQNKQFVTPSKIFTFGDLKVDTINSPHKRVTWWFHVVAAYRVQNQVYVIDPAIEPSHVLTFEDWIARMGGQAAGQEFSICDAAIYEPFNRCKGGVAMPAPDVVRQEEFYLSQEWRRLVQLNRQPELELGDAPPWK